MLEKLELLILVLFNVLNVATSIDSIECGSVNYFVTDNSSVLCCKYST